MRKLYALFAGICMSLASIPTHAQLVTPDVANFNFAVNAPVNHVVFTNTSTIGSIPGIRKAFWSFGDGTVQMTPPLHGTQHQYASSGNYNVCLKLYRYTNSGDSFLTAQVCKAVSIETVCRANFETHDSIISLTPLKYKVKFWAIPFHNAHKQVIQVCWIFGDGRDTCINLTSITTPPALLTVEHIYSGQGPYNVCVRIKYADGCVAEKCKSMTWQHAPPDSCRADFERISLASINNPLRPTFRALPWHNYNKRPVRICWTFGDGRDTCIQYSNTNPPGPYVVSHTYATPGNYEVCVKILYEGGCEARKCKPVQIGHRPDTCQADFERVPVTIGITNLVGFKALPAHNNNKKPQRICWQFGDGRDTCINYPENYTGQYNVLHQYQHPGNYEVCVKINYYGGCEARKCKLVRVGELPDTCRADFERLPVASLAHPLHAIFKALPSHNNNRKPVRICWQFGDGRDTCINYPPSYTGLYLVSHNYSAPGSYEVCVKIFYEGGCEARKCKLVIIPPPQVHCSVGLTQTNPSVNSTTRGFVATPNAVPFRRPVRICWTFGDGADTCIMITPAMPITNFFIQHTYPGPGNYRACVRVLFDGGCVAEACKEVVIRNPSNVCGGYMLDSLIAPRTFKFKGFSINNPNDEVLSYRWSFGDGTTALGREVTHTYNHGGNYEVCLVIRTRLGCETRICKPLHVPGTNIHALHLAPNPVINTLHVSFFSTHTEQVTVRIRNAMGTVVRTEIRNVSAGPNTWNYELPGLLPGVYSLTVQSDHQMASALFIKQ